MSYATGKNDTYDMWAAQCVNRSCVASLAFLMWELFTTLDDEVEFIWCRPWMWSKVLYIFIRYFALSVQLTLLFVSIGLPHESRASSFCHGSFVFQAVTMQILVSSVDIVLMLRVQALYSNNNYVKYSTFVLFGLELLFMTSCLYLTVRGLQFDDMCIVTKSPKAILGFGAAAIIFEFILFLLTFIKFVQALRSTWRYTPVIQVLIRDGTWAFALILLAMLVNAICFSAISGGLSAIGINWLMSVLAFAGCRLVLNMHRLASPRAQTPYSTWEIEADRTMHNTHLDFSISEPSDEGHEAGSEHDAYELAESPAASIFPNRKGKAKEMPSGTGGAFRFLETAMSSIDEASGSSVRCTWTPSTPSVNYGSPSDSTLVDMQSEVNLAECRHRSSYTSPGPLSPTAEDPLLASTSSLVIP